MASQATRYCTESTVTPGGRVLPSLGVMPPRKDSDQSVGKCPIYDERSLNDFCFYKDAFSFPRLRMAGRGAQIPDMLYAPSTIPHA
ncbi:10527_t:CDS:2 [Acaulospora colombiana]|uniref:10527_t:CDS:1 n=1 Tax=Acaulospora colombiana TaxID=27376 RepID=A0ACA9PIA4_9GLOM|nr:10527_t:CDS:2 [Acaulospora colombiana]